MKIAERDEVEMVMRRLVKGGLIKRLPKNRRDTEIFLALAASSLDPRARYSEPEVNVMLREWMRDFTCDVSMDHVSVRRCLVDYRLLLREESGKDYRANQVVINCTIEPAARSVDPQQIFYDVQEERELRKRAVNAT